MDKTIIVHNPISNEVIGEVPITSSKEINFKLDIAHEISEKYNLSSLFQRQKILKMFRLGILNNMDQIIRIICSETGKKYDEGLIEVFISLEHLKNTTENLFEALKKEYRRVGVFKTKKAWIEYEPLGVAAIISPWNYPLILTISPLVEALLAGNAVILKPSEKTPLTAELLKSIWDESTKNPKLFQLVNGDAKAGEQLVSSRKTNVICFTGSTTVGKKIAETCASMLKPVILELGGKDPMLILSDANLDRAVQAALWGGFSNAGQTCISVEHIFVEEICYLTFIDKLSILIKKMSSGPGDEEIGSISVKSNFDKVNDQINEVKNQTSIIEGKSKGGWFIPPTIVINPKENTKLLKQETFGPVMTIHPFCSDAEVINKVNSSGYGLSASIFGKNKKRMRDISKKIKSGTICFNDVLTNYGISDLPFGGVGLSGIGKVHGKEGIRSFSLQKSYLTNRIQLQSELWWYKNRGKYSDLIKKFIKWYYS